MKKVITLNILTATLLFANIDIQPNLLENQNLEKNIKKTEALKIKTNIINDINFNLDFSKTYINNDFYNDSSSFNVSFNQDIFRSGGILYSLEASDIYNKIRDLNYDINLNEIIKNIVDIKYSNEINKLNLTLNLLNKDYLNIEKTIAEEEYKAGIGSFLNINNKIINLNNNLIDYSNINNNFKIIKNNFAKFSSKNINDYILPVVNEVSLNDFLNSNDIKLQKEQSKYNEKMLDLEKTKYLPKVSIYGSYKDEFGEENIINKDNNSTIGLKISMPLKLTKNYDVESLKLTNLKDKININEKIRNKELYFKNIQQNIENYNNNIKILENISLNWFNNFKEKENEFKANIISKKQLDLFDFQYKISKINIELEKIKKNKYLTLEYLEF